MAADIKNRTRLLRSLAVAAAALTLAGCMPVKTFQVSAVDDLTLRQSRTADYRGVLGEPRTREVTTTAAGRFESLRYEMSDDDTLDTCVRLLEIEFRDDLFNAYLSGSSCSVDETHADTAAAEQVRKRIGLASTEDAVAVLGRPSGNAVCPTEIAAYADMCRDASQVLAWLALPTRGFGGGGEMRTQLVLVSFDARGKVYDIRVEERTGSSPSARVAPPVQMGNTLPQQ